MKQGLDIAELNRLYTEAESADAELFAEQRSNLLLVAGDHWNKAGSKFWNRIRESKDLSKETKLRITKNHIQRITKGIVNSIVSAAPGVQIKPKHDSELSDQKAAELHSAVLADIKQRHRFKHKVRQWCEDYVNIGECAVKVFWDADKGMVIDYEPEVDEQTGFPMIDPMTGQVQKSDRPIFSGDLVFERIYGFNLLRAPDAKSFDESEFVIYRKMVDIDQLKRMVGEDPKKLKFIHETADDTYTVFEASSGTYKQAKGQMMVREFYWRPCAQYPEGWYAITTIEGILFEGPLPLGAFPIVYVGFDEIATSPRARSIIKVLRPIQVELNRAVSAMAQTQSSMGMDKLLVQDGSKLSHGAELPGIRVVKYSGSIPTVLPGRTGDQFAAYAESQVKELYSVANMADEDEQLPAQLDPYAMLFRSMRQKKRFSLYAEKFEQFLIDVTELALRLSKAYMPESLLVPAVGRKEFINIAEFKKSDDLSHQITLEEGSLDPETKLGRTITFQHLLQYVGAQLNKEDIGRMIRSLPYANNEEAYGDLTINYDIVKNDILAMDRGQYRPANQYDDHKYVIKRLIHRMRQPDFEFLPPAIQSLYQQKVQEHEMAEADQQRKLLAAKNDLIPAQGFMVPVDFYVADPRDPNKTRRARVPYDALAWLIQRLQDQGSLIEGLADAPDQMKVELSEKLQGSQPPGSPQQPQHSPGSPVGYVPTPDTAMPMDAQKSLNQQAAWGGGPN